MTGGHWVDWIAAEGGRSIGGILPLLGIGGLLHVGPGRRGRRSWLFVLSALALSALAPLLWIRRRPHVSSPIQETAFWCAALSLLWTGCAVVAHRWSRYRERGRETEGAGSASRAIEGRFCYGTASRPISLSGDLCDPFRVMGLMLGVAAGVLVTTVLAMRCILVTIDLIRANSGATSSLPFEPNGLVTLGLLLAAALIGALVWRDRRLGTCALVVMFLMVAWRCLLLPPIRPNAVGGYERGETALALMLTVSFLRSVVVMSMYVVHGWRRKKRSADALRPWPGLVWLGIVISAGMALLGCFHLAVPLPAGRWGARETLLLSTLALAVTAITDYRLLRMRWNRALEEWTLGLTALSLCGVVVQFVPDGPWSATERYPMVFNAVMVGLTIASLLCIHEATRLRPVPPRSSSGAEDPPGATDGGWDGAAGRRFRTAVRMAFLTASVAMLSGIVMAVWPRWPVVGVSDDSFGRLACGLAANILLIYATLWGARRLGRPTFELLSVLGVLSAVGFLLGRVLPYTPYFG